MPYRDPPPIPIVVVGPRIVTSIRPVYSGRPSNAKVQKVLVRFPEAEFYTLEAVAGGLDIAMQTVHNVLHRFKAEFDPPIYKKKRHRYYRLLTAKDVAFFRRRYPFYRRLPDA